MEKRAGIPHCTLQNYERDFRDRHLLQGVLAKWAAKRPQAPAIIQSEHRRELSWAVLEESATTLAIQLIRLGFRKGDYLATSLPMLLEHIFLEYACFKIGVIHAPLDLRLRPPEVVRSLGLIRPKGYVFLGPELGGVVRPVCPYVEHFLEVRELIELVARGRADLSADDEAAYQEATVAVQPDDGAQVIFTTGSTGTPKPALLSHRNITCQNMCLGTAFAFDERTRLLVNLPPSHVAGQSEALMTTLFFGGTAVTLEVFDAARSLEAIQEYRIDKLGQIPAMFNLEWRLAEQARYDLSSLKLALYGGQQVPRQFLERLARMAPRIGTGLGLTECAGFCTYTPLDATVEEIAAGIGYDMPVYPLSIREPMRADRSAGGELPDGEIGHICFRGPQTFLGYVNDPESTAKTISREGYLYTGDMGSKDAEGLHLAGRAKWVIKPAGYQVFPGDVENHLCALSDKVASAGAVGVEHKVFSEAIVAFVEKKPGVELSVKELKQHARSMASYMRPLHYLLLEPGQMPLNRAAKIDYVRLAQLAREQVSRKERKESAKTAKETFP
jgi:acyl-CoA synthetase (AMP-forming)/AMP-acid ligase II